MSQPAEQMPHVTEFQDIDISRIDVREGFNPRRYFDPDALQELADSIRKDGVIQPIVIRPQENSGRYFIVAGERRWRASQLAGLNTIPSVIKHVDENQARILSIVENFERENVTPMEEADAARKILDVVEGDRDEAAKVIGWSRKLFDSRLLLLHCTSEVQDALIERKIMLGHAELLAALPEKTQVGTLKKVLEENWLVKDLKKRVMSFLSRRNLQSAVFDVSGCQGCRHNTSDQVELFAENVGAGYCGLPECWDEKLTAWLATRKQELTTEYTHIFTDIEKDPSTWVTLMPSGDNGVGEAQLDACKGCEHYGAIMSTQPGKEGAIIHDDVCFNLPCNKDKITAYQDSLGVAQSPADQEPPAKSSGSAKSASKSTQKKAVSRPAGLTPKKVIDHINHFYRETNADVITTSPTMIAVYGILAMQREASGNAKPIKALEKEFSCLKASTRAKRIAGLFELDDTALERITRTYVTCIAQMMDEFTSRGEYLDGAKASLKCLKTDLRLHFLVDKAFLEIHTKGGLMELLRKAKNAKGETFVEVYETKHEKGAFNKLDKMKHPDMIKAILDTKYDFAGYVPKDVTLG
jgi:ParB family transcriptional regulator, chromosome partitioning protein